MKKAAHTTAMSRLRQDYMRMKKSPVPFITAEPMPANILEWHYVVTGPPDSLYAGGYYHGKLVFPREFPFKPPSILMMTPNGRFKCNTRLCLSISDFHPDTWNPAWSVSTILTGLLSFMLETSPTLGSIETSEYQKRHLAAQSGAFNVKDKIFCDLFPDLTEEIRENLKKMEELTNQSNQPESDEALRQLVGGDQQNSLLSSAFTNLAVIIGFALFAYTVKTILRSAAE